MPDAIDSKRTIDYVLNDYEELTMNLVRLGDFMVMGLSILQPRVENHSLDEELIRRALEFMQRRHPMLRAFQDDYDPSTRKFRIRIRADYDADPRKFASSIDLDCANLNDGAKRSRDDMVRLLDAFIDRPFENGPNNLLWRLKAVEYREDQIRKYALAMVVQLQVADGICITALMYELMNILNALKSGRTCEEMVTRLDLVPSMYEKCLMDGLFGVEQQNKVNELIAKPPVAFLLNEKLKSPDEAGTKMYFFPIDKELSQKLLNNARKNGLRLTGYFTTAAIFSLNELYTELNLPQINEFSASIPANMRIRYQPNMNHSSMSCQTCVAHIDVKDLQPCGDIWQESKRVHDLVEEATDFKSGSIFSLSHNEIFLQNFKNVMKMSETLTEARSRIHQDHDCDLLISNVGKHVWRAKSVNDDAFKLSEIYFGDSAQSSPIILPALMFHISFWNDQVMVQLSGNTSCIRAKHLDRYVELFKQTLTKSA